jgi:hypothetical protein
MGNNPINGIDPDGGWVKGAGLLRNIFMSDYNIAQRATMKANSGPASLWFEGFTEDGTSSFILKEGITD